MEKPGRKLPGTISARLTLSGRRQHGSETRHPGLAIIHIVTKAVSLGGASQAWASHLTLK